MELTDFLEMDMLGEHLSLIHIYAISIVETWITSGIEFDAICAACDEMAIGAILALQDAGIDDVVVAGIDGLQMGCEYVKNGDMTLTFYADAKGLAYESLDAALALALKRMQITTKMSCPLYSFI